jgi:hypothetical protein
MPKIFFWQPGPSLDREQALTRPASPKCPSIRGLPHISTGTGEGKRRVSIVQTTAIVRTQELIEADSLRI